MEDKTRVKELERKNRELEHMLERNVDVSNENFAAIISQLHSMKLTIRFLLWAMLLIAIALFTMGVFLT